MVRSIAFDSLVQDNNHFRSAISTSKEPNPGEDRIAQRRLLHVEQDTSVQIRMRSLLGKPYVQQIGLYLLEPCDIGKSQRQCGCES